MKPTTSPRSGRNSATTRRNKYFPPPIKSSPFLSDREERFLKYCHDNGFYPKEVKKGEGRNARRTWEVVFEPEYLDTTEKRVVEYCEKHHIPYTFCRDADGNHHYDWQHGGMIDFSGYEKLPETYINLDKILWDKRKNGVPVSRIVVDETPEPDNHRNPKPSVWSWFRGLFKKKKTQTPPTKMDLFYSSLREATGLGRHTLLALGLPFDDPEEFEKYYDTLLREEKERNELRNSVEERWLPPTED